MATTKDYRLGEFTFPRGCFMIADAAELNNTSCVVIDGGGSNVEGDRIPCPYHAWRFGPVCFPGAGLFFAESTAPLRAGGASPRSP